MINIIRPYLILAICFANATSWGQSSPELNKFQWGVSAGLNQYKEPGLMQLQGTEVGLHLKTMEWSLLPSAQLEGDFLLGSQKYTSEGSGNKNGVTNLETRWRSLFPVFEDSANNDGYFWGLALHTLWNDLRGTTTFQGNTYGGYQRSATQLWLPMRWIGENFWQVDTGILIYGRHLSKLSEVNTHYQDITNTQRKGQYAQFSLSVPLDNGDSLKPFVRYTHLADSNVVFMGGANWIEPDSQRWQIGAIWEFAGP